MDYLKLVAGIGLLIAFGWLLVRNKNRKGFVHALFRVDTFIGIVAGLYLIFTSINSL